MSGSFISPIAIDGPYVSEASLWIDPTPPAGGLRGDLNLDVPEHLELAREDDKIVLPFRLTTTMVLREGTDDRMRASVEMRGSVSAPSAAVESDDEALRVLRLNAVSLFYSASRSYIEVLTGQSLIGRFNLPAIDPQAFIDSTAAAESR